MALNLMRFIFFLFLRPRYKYFSTSKKEFPDVFIIYTSLSRITYICKIHHFIISLFYFFSL